MPSPTRDGRRGSNYAVFLPEKKNVVSTPDVGTDGVQGQEVIEERE